MNMNGMMYAGAARRTASQPVLQRFDLANAAAANTASATGGVIADRIAKEKRNMCAAGGMAPSLITAGTSSDTITMYDGVVGMPMPRTMPAIAVSTSAAAS